MGGGGGTVTQTRDKGGGSQKEFFRPFGPQFGLEINRIPPLDPPLVCIGL